jgi:hypothetical protein
MGGNAPPINEAVNFLHKFSPASLEKLKQTLPAEILPLLKAGGLAGRTDPLLEPRARVCLAALEEVMPRCDEGIKASGARLRRARRLSLAAGVAAMVGSSSVLATLGAGSNVLGAGTNILAAVSGVIALVGSVLAFVAEFTTRPDHEAKKTVFDTYMLLSRSRYRAEQLRGELSTHIDAGISAKREDAVAGLIGEANALCLNVIDLRASLLI